MSDQIYQIEKNQQYVLIRILVDKLTAVHSPKLKEELTQLEEEEVENIIIDLENVNYCHSSALSFILNTNRLVNAQEGCLVLCNLQKAVKNLVEIPKLDDILNITPTFSEARDYLYMVALEKDLGTSEEDLG